MQKMNSVLIYGLFGEHWRMDFLQHYTSVVKKQTNKQQQQKTNKQQFKRLLILVLKFIRWELELQPNKSVQLI